MYCSKVSVMLNYTCCKNPVAFSLWKMLYRQVCDMLILFITLSQYATEWGQKRQGIKTQKFYYMYISLTTLTVITEYNLPSEIQSELVN